jgi:hypothetical protein
VARVWCGDTWVVSLDRGYRREAGEALERYKAEVGFRK